MMQMFITLFIALDGTEKSAWLSFSHLEIAENRVIFGGIYFPFINSKYSHPAISPYLHHEFTDLFKLCSYCEFEHQ